MKPGVQNWFLYRYRLKFWAQSPKFKRVSLNETPGLYFCCLNICEDFDLRYSENGEYEEMTLNNIIFYNKNIDIYKTD